MTEYRLPIPPSSNNAYFNNKWGGRTLAPEGAAWKLNAQRELRLQKAEPFEGRAIIHIDLSEKDCSVLSDCANREKLVTDALVDAGVLKNDNMKHVKRVSIGWEPEIRGCRVRLERA